MWCCVSSVFCGALSNKAYVPRRISGIHDHQRNQAVASPRLLEIGPSPIKRPEGVLSEQFRDGLPSSDLSWPGLQAQNDELIVAAKVECLGSDLSLQESDRCLWPRTLAVL